jgi:hypothetical protein
MKTKSFNELFFSRTHEFLDGYLPSQCSRSPHTVKAYRDSLTVFRRYVTLQGISLKKFGFEDCTRDFLLGFMEYLQKAVDLGYGSRYKLELDELSPINLKALHGESAFDLLIEKAQRNFVERS